MKLRGLGPFYAGLVVARACGFTDVLPVNEPRALAYAGRLFGHDRPLSPEELVEVAEPWRPFRTWAIVLIRLAGDRSG